MRVIRETLAKRDDAPRSFPVACHLLTSVSRDREEAEATARVALARYATIPVYRESFRRLGFGSDLDELAPFMKGEDLGAAASRISKEMLDELVVYGTPSDCASKIGQFVKHGVTEPVIYPSESGKVGFPRAIDATISLMAHQIR